MCYGLGADEYRIRGKSKTFGLDLSSLSSRRGSLIFTLHMRIHSPMPHVPFANTMRVWSPDVSLVRSRPTPPICWYDPQWYLTSCFVITPVLVMSLLRHHNIAFLISLDLVSCGPGSVSYISVRSVLFYFSSLPPLYFLSLWSSCARSSSVSPIFSRFPFPITFSVPTCIAINHRVPEAPPTYRDVTPLSSTYYHYQLSYAYPIFISLFFTFLL